MVFVDVGIVLFTDFFPSFNLFRSRQDKKRILRVNIKKPAGGLSYRGTTVEFSPPKIWIEV